MKLRYSGRVAGDTYEVRDPAGGVVKEIPLDQARSDSKLAAAIARNGWDPIPEN